MEAARRTWISSTLAWREREHRRRARGARLARAGRHAATPLEDRRRDDGRRAERIVASGIDGVSVEGIDPMWLLRFDDPAREAPLPPPAARESGVLFKRGAYNFAALAHDEEAIARDRGGRERRVRRAGARARVMPSDRRPSAPLAGAAPLIDVHAHFFHAGCGRADWRALNAARFRAGERIGITYHVASVLGSWGLTSPTYFPSPADMTLRQRRDARDRRAREPERVRRYVAVNPNDTGARARARSSAASRAARSA